MHKMTIAAVSLAQWFPFQHSGIPRTPEGKPNLTAPPPQTPDGRPDLSGLLRGRVTFPWQRCLGAARGVFQQHLPLSETPSRALQAAA
jgi:hypothetical protein